MLMDVVYPISSRCGWGNYEELRYSLRSLKSVEYGRVFIVGNLPSWCTNVIHIPMKDPNVCKDTNMIQKILRVCYEDISDDFIRASDDQYFLRPYKRGYYYNGSLKNGESTYSHIAQNTLELLRNEGKTTLNFDCHVPQIIDKHQYPEIMLNCPFAEGIGVLVNSFYFNMLDVQGVEVNMTKSEDTEGKDFLNHNDTGLPENLKAKIMELFSEKSKYEI